MISLCITTWNRDDLVLKSFEKVLHDERISEIVIVDDCSDIGFYQSLQYKIERLKAESPDAFYKIKLYHNDKNLDCYRNKREAISKASNAWAIILDSDNVIDVDFLNALWTQKEWDRFTIYSPEFARPHFDFRQMSGQTITKQNVHEFVLIKPQFWWLINAMNYMVNTHEYLKVWDGSIDPVTSDTIYQNYNWLKAGNHIRVVPEMQYDHLVHSGSHYKKNNHRTGNLFEELIQKLTDMR